MGYLRRLIVWLIRAWPVLLLVPVGALHMTALLLFPSNSIFVNKLTGTFLQIGGGVVVLLSLDGNLGLFKKQGLLTTFCRYLHDFPRTGNRYMSLGTVEMRAALTASAELSVARPPANTLEQRVVELERKLQEEHTRLRNLEVSVRERLTELKLDLSSSITAVDTSLRELGEKVERTALGGLKQQLFGVLLAVYGACVSVFA